MRIPLLNSGGDNFWVNSSKRFRLKTAAGYLRMLSDNRRCEMDNSMIYICMGKDSFTQSGESDNNPFHIQPVPAPWQTSFLYCKEEHLSVESDHREQPEYR